MLFKIAFNNVKKSYKDYSVYFLTLTLGVAVFYAFNSINGQTVMGDINSSGRYYVELIETTMSIVSVFISFILGGLVVYANNFLVKRRKKELGIYMTLGMPKKRIASILLVETFIIGIFSLFAGISLGILGSQGLSIITSFLFELDIEKYSFIFSPSALIKTIIYFALIFIVTMIFNSIVIAKYKIIDLIYGSKKNEKVKISNSKLSIVIFIMSLAILGFAYYRVNSPDPMHMDMLVDILFPTILGIIGTFMFFFSLSTLFLKMFSFKKNNYYKGINLFVAKQINSKINTNFVAMSVISLMLFITICALSTSLGFRQFTENEINMSAPFDAVMETYLDEGGDYDPNTVKMKKFLETYGVKVPKKDKVVEYRSYSSETTLSELLKTDLNMYNPGIICISISDHNRLRSLLNKKPMELKDDEVLLGGKITEGEKKLDDLVKKGGEIKLNKKTYTVANKELIKENHRIGNMYEYVIAILPDKDIKELTPMRLSMNVMYDNKEISEKEFIKTQTLSVDTIKGERQPIFGNTKEIFATELRGLSTLILYVGVYLGVIFLLTSAAVLSLQQLSEASDSLERYKSLKKIGVSETMINTSIFKQILIYFFAPLSLAIVDSIFGIMFIRDYLLGFNRGNILEPTLVIFTFIMLIYLTYLLITYMSYKNIIRNK